MKKSTKNLLIAIIIILILIILLPWGWILIRNKIDSISIAMSENMPHSVRAEIVKVTDYGIYAMGIEGYPTGLFSLGFTDEGDIGFKQGQEILIDYRGYVMAMYPAQIGHVDKITIVKEKSDVEIPEEYLKFCYSSKSNVKISINEFTNESLELTIVDTNELPYNYTTDYTIYKEVKNKDYTGVGQKIGEDTENTTAGFTGTGSEYIWEEIPKISNILCKDTVEDKTYNLPSIKEGEHYTVNGWKLDYSKLYGKLEEGKYYFTLKAESFWIKIDFTVDAAGKVNYSDPEVI